MTYYNEKIVNTSFDEAKGKVLEELKNEGFGVLTEIDITKTLKEKLNVDFRKYKILGACNPALAYEALQSEENIGLMLPCNIVIQETINGEVKVAGINPMESMKSAGNQNLLALAEKVSSKLKKVIENI